MDDWNVGYEITGRTEDIFGHAPYVFGLSAGTALAYQFSTTSANGVRPSLGSRKEPVALVASTLAR
jgi:hypothetical protein